MDVPNRVREEIIFNEINFDELTFGEVVGRGAFGVVNKASYRGKVVAVKLIETQTEIQTFVTELKQLSRINHANIVQLYGACTSTKTPVCLVMEYAEGGSLYNVLHGPKPRIPYTAGHAVSWLRQIAYGVCYLHGMKPKPLIHRDLKPPNLLLQNGGTTVKICDFGTACDAHTYMTNNKGSAAWMAPEVFEGVNYTEKCDVFSFGIIVWQVLTRKKPFDDLGGPAFRIMWQVHNGTRPALIKNCPPSLERLMTSCWSVLSAERPSMVDVVSLLTLLLPFFPGGGQPLCFPDAAEPEAPSQRGADARADTVRQRRRGEVCGEAVPVAPQSPSQLIPIVVEELPSLPHANRLTSAPASLAASRENLPHLASPTSSAAAAEPQLPAAVTSTSHTAQHNHAANSSSSTSNPSQSFVRGHRRTGSHGNAAEAPKHAAPAVRGHRRAGSHGSARVVLNAPPVTSEFVQPAAPQWPPPQPPAQHQPPPPMHSWQPAPVWQPPPPPHGQHPPLYQWPPPAQQLPPHHASWNSYYTWQPGTAVHRPAYPPAAGQLPPLHSPQQHPHSLPPVSHLAELPPAVQQPPNQLAGPPGWRWRDFTSSSNPALNISLAALDHQLQPLEPCPHSAESKEIYKRHCELAQEYIRVQTEIVYLQQQNKETHEYLAQVEQDFQHNARFMKDYQDQLKEKESLQLLVSELSNQVQQR